MVSRDPRFVGFWVNSAIRDRFLSHCAKSDLDNLRLVCHDFAGKVEPFLFKHVSVTFKPRTFSNIARMTHLKRIGHHVETFTFNMPHGPETLLPPLLQAESGEERSFAYKPHARLQERPGSSRRVKAEQFGSMEVADMLIQQYPPLFHAATNVSAFVKAFSLLSNLKHVRINCPEDKRSPHCRRSIVDYALISLRIALEQAPLNHLDSFSVMSLHEEGLLYLQPLSAFGADPRSCRRWSSIKHLNMRLQCREASDPKKTNTLKILHSYLGNFTSLQSFQFQWQDAKGPFPLSLHNEPRLIPVATRDEGSQTPPMQRLKLPELRCFVIQNATTDAWQISNVLYRLRKQISECNFEDVELRSGDWDLALEPLYRMAQRSRFRRRPKPPEQDSMEVPLILSAEDLSPKRALRSPRVQKQVSFETTTSYPGHPAVEDLSALEEMPEQALAYSKHQSKASRAIARAKEHLLETTGHFKDFMRLPGWR